MRVGIPAATQPLLTPRHQAPAPAAANPAVGPLCGGIEADRGKQVHPMRKRAA